MPAPLTTEQLRKKYIELSEGTVGQAATTYEVETSNGEIVRVILGATARFPGFTSVEEIPALGVVVEPANLPSDVQVWGRRFAGPAWPSWVGIAAAIDAVALDSLEIRSRLL